MSKLTHSDLAKFVQRNLDIEDINVIIHLLLQEHVISSHAIEGDVLDLDCDEAVDLLLQVIFNLENNGLNDIY